MRVNIIINLQVEGIHCWPDAGQFDVTVQFLEYPHRHIFHITCEKSVTHDDRDIEIILFKRAVRDYLEITYMSPTYAMLDFGNMSCEMIARLLVKDFNLESCTVLEDGENGAKVMRQ